MAAREYLEQYRALDRQLDAKIEQTERLREFLTRTSSGGSAAHSPQPYDKVGEITAKIVDMENEANELINKLLEMQIVIRGSIARITDESVRNVIELRYLNGYSFAKIARTVDRSMRTVFYNHDKGITILEATWEIL